MLARLSALTGILVVLAWGVGRWFNDDHLWSQWLFWIPTLVVVVFAWVTLVVSAICSKLSLRMGGVKLRPFLAVGALVATGWMIVSWHPMNVGAGWNTPNTPRYTVAYWNISVDRQAQDAADAVLEEEPDIAIVANIRWDVHREPLVTKLRSLAPAEGEGVHVLQRGSLSIAGRFPIRRYGVARLERVATLLESWRSERDTGRITFVEFETSEDLGGVPLTVWIVDLPSDPSMKRADVMRAASRAVSAWEGVAMAPDALGRWIQQTPVEGERGFPEPDLIIGDFNAPRGSRSIGQLVGDRPSTHAQAGVGPAGTWMRYLPLWAIDQAYTGDRVKATRSSVVDPGLSEHRMLVVELERD